MATFAEQLKAIRKEQEFTQEQLAQELNISRTTISRWEKGIMMPDIETIKQLSKALNYNFFTVEELSENAQAAPEEEEAPAVLPEAPDLPAKPAPRKKRLVLISALGAAVLAVIAIVCLLINQKPAEAPVNAYEPFTYEWYQQPQTPVEGQAFVQITLDEDPIPVVQDEKFPDGYGWLFTFKMKEVNGIPFTAEKITYQLFDAEKRSDMWTYGSEDIQRSFGSPLLANGRTAEWRGGLRYQLMNGAAIAVEGTDGNGNVLTFYRFAELSKELPK